MPITFDCSGCGKKFIIKNEKLAGRMGSCSACGAKMVIPEPGGYDLEFSPEPTQARVHPQPARPEMADDLIESDDFVELMPDRKTGLGLGLDLMVGVVAGLAGCLLVGGLVIRMMWSGQPAKVEAIAKAGPMVKAPGDVAPAANRATVGDPAAALPEAIVPPQPITVPADAAPPQTGPLTTEQIITRADPAVGVVRGPTSSGTGFLVGPGLLATNAHVIRRTPSASLQVHFPSAPSADRGPFNVKVVYFDDERDLAILSLPSRLDPLPVYGDHVFRRGQDVVFIGSPGLGGAMILENVASRGIIGSKVKSDDLEYYQLSGSVNGGNSGGPIIDMQGRVIGVVTARASKEEGLGFCVPAADLAAAVKTASSRNLTLQEDAARRHDASAKLATIRVGRSKNVARGPDDETAEFLKTTEPATWLASVDSNLVLKDSSPRVKPFRTRLKKADTIYSEDDRVIASLLIQAVMKVRDAGLPLSCALLLESSLTWAPDGYLRGSVARSFQVFTENYCDFRIKERLDHKSTILRMQSILAKPSATTQENPPPAPSVATTPSAKPATRPINPDSPAGKFETASSLEEDGNTQAAIFAYEALIEKFPLTSQADEAKNRLKKLKR